MKKETVKPLPKNSVLELRGYAAYKAYMAYHSLFMGVKMLPDYMKYTYEKFLEMVEGLSISEKEKILRLGAQFVKLEQEDVEAILALHTDPNGVPYGTINLKNLTPPLVIEIITRVCLECSLIKIDLITEAEKKN